MGRRTVLLLSAAVVAAVGAAMIFLYVQGINDRAVADQQLVQVLRAKDTIAAGESIDAAQAAGKLELAALPKASILDGALTSTQSVAGEVALDPIYPKEQILALKFGAAGTQQTITIPDGTMAISVQLTDPARVAGFVTPGSKVAIFLSSSSSDTVAAGFTRLMLPKVEVIGVGDSTILSTTKTDVTGTQTTEAIPKTILTLALTQSEAERIIYGAGNGELSFGLLNDKSTVRASKGVTSTNLFN